MNDLFHGPVPAITFFARRAKASLVGTSRLRLWVTIFSVWSFAIFLAAMTAIGQFKVIGPPPYSPSVAHQKIRTLLEGINPGNRQKTVETLIGLLAWYRDILDEELIAAWRKDTRANLPGAAESLADSRVASAIVEFSWRESRATAFNIAYAPMFSNLMTRFPESATPFLNDLLGPQTPDLSAPEAETVCRILLDMPDIGTWKKSALEILPHYRQAAESLLTQDMRGSDREKSFQAQVWMNDLGIDVPGGSNDQPRQRRRPIPSISSGTIPSDDDQPPRPRRRSSPSLSSAPGGSESAVLVQPASDDREPASLAVNSVAAPTPLQAPPVPATPLPPSAQPPSAPPLSPAPLYSGARTGTLESTGGPIPQNAEYVFRNLPPVKMQLDYDTKIWDARLSPGEGQTQKLIVRNKSSGPQKHCVVHWSVIP